MTRKLQTPILRIRPKIRGLRWAHSKTCLAALLILILSFLILSCGLDIEDPTPPSPPVWVQKSLPEEWPERGIDAHESGGIFLEWEPNPEDDISAYHIYRAKWFGGNDSLGNFDHLARLDIESQNQLEYIDLKISTRTRYYYKIKAEDISGSIGEFSDSLSFMLIPSIVSNEMVPNGLSATLDVSRLLRWEYHYFIEMENYCLTLLTSENELIIRKLFLPGDYVSGIEYWRIPDEIILDSTTIYKWRLDVSANYIEENETAGGESTWANFVYNGF